MIDFIHSDIGRLADEWFVGKRITAVVRGILQEHYIDVVNVSGGYVAKWQIIHKQKSIEPIYDDIGDAYHAALKMIIEWALDG